MKFNCDEAYLPVGVASCSVVIRGNNGSFVRAYSKRLGRYSILEVELWTILYGLCDKGIHR